MNLPIFRDENQTLQLMQSKWSSLLNVLLNKPLSNAGILKDVSLVTGSNTVNHLLGRKMQGWMISDLDTAAQIYRTEPLNDKTVTLNSSANCVVTLVVY